MTYLTTIIIIIFIIVTCLLFCSGGGEAGDGECRREARSHPPGGRVRVTLAEGGTLTQHTEEPPADTKVGPPPVESPYATLIVVGIHDDDDDDDDDGSVKHNDKKKKLNRKLNFKCDSCHWDLSECDPDQTPDPDLGNHCASVPGSVDRLNVILSKRSRPPLTPERFGNPSPVVVKGELDLSPRLPSPSKPTCSLATTAQ